MGSDAALTSAIADYLSFAAIEKGLSKNTIAAYRLDLAGFSEFMAGGGKTIEDVTPTLMEPSALSATAFGPIPRIQTAPVWE